VAAWPRALSGSFRCIAAGNVLTAGAEGTLKGFLVGTLVAVLLVIATLFAYDRLQIDSSQGYRPAPYVHVDQTEFGRG